jgi:gamma-butyrobetaine dioxygenase
MTDDIEGLSVSEDRRRLVVTWTSGRSIAAPAPWLLDNVEGGCDARSGHRFAGGLSLASAATIHEARLDGGSIVLRFSPGDEARRVPLSLLIDEPAAVPAPDLWPRADRIADTPPIAFDRYMRDDAALSAALSLLVRRGLVFLTGLGTEPGTVERAVARFGYIRETNYGRLFEVREEAKASHLAYTSGGLELHTDNPYRDPVPTLQALHVIEAASTGGESRFADGLAHAEALRREAPDRFEALATHAVAFAYRGPAGERYTARSPVIETDADGSVVGVRVNHRALRAPPLAAGWAEGWYDAYLDVYARLHAPASVLERSLAPGEAVIFDNRRIVHGRAAYRGGGRRWLQGCYADVDGARATLSRLEASR